MTQRIWMSQVRESRIWQRERPGRPKNRVFGHPEKFEKFGYLGWGCFFGTDVHHGFCGVALDFRDCQRLIVPGVKP